MSGVVLPPVQGALPTGDPVSPISPSPPSSLPPAPLLPSVVSVHSAVRTPAGRSRSTTGQVDSRYAGLAARKVLLCNEVEPIQYTFWGGEETELPRGPGKELDLGEVIRMAVFECGKTGRNAGTVRLINSTGFHRFLIDAFWLVYFTVLRSLDHDAMCRSFRNHLLQEQQQQQQQQQQDKTVLSKSTTDTSDTPIEASEPPVTAFLPELPGTPQHFRGASPLVNSLSEDPPLPPPWEDDLDDVAPQDPQYEMGVLFGRMALQYCTLFQGTRLPISQKDLMLKDLPDLVTFALKRLYLCTMPYATGLLSTPQFTEYVLRHVSYWIGGVERNAICTAKYGKSTKKSFHATALVTMFMKGFGKRGVRRVSQQAVAKEQTPMALQNEEGIRQELLSLKRAFAEITQPHDVAEAEVMVGATATAGPVSPSPPSGKRRSVAWYERGRHEGSVQKSVASDSSLFHLEQRSPLLTRFGNDHNLPVKLKVKMTWLKPSPPPELASGLLPARRKKGKV